MISYPHPSLSLADNTMQYIDIPEMESDQILEDIDALISTASMSYPDTSTKQAAEMGSAMTTKRNRENESSTQSNSF